MTEPTPPPVSSGADTILCNECQHEVPALDFCVRCGDPLAEEKRAQAALTGRRTQFAAYPGEHALGVHLVSTLFPQLPRADMATFRTVLIIGLLSIIGLAGVGFFPLALIAAALLVPLMLVLYVWDVDVYEDEPFRVMVFTAAWGIVAGLVVGLLIRMLPTGAGIISAVGTSEILGRGILVPVASGLAMLAGPLILLPYQKFNDVLDGATFGATSAVAFTGALVLSQGADLFGAGLRPPGDSLPWIVRLMSLGIATPLIAAGVIGAAAGAFWLRYRAPVRDRAKMGLVGQPVVATVVALLFLIASALGAQLLPFLPVLVWQSVLAVFAMIWLRAVIHLGLLQEASEIPIWAGRRVPGLRLPHPCAQLLRQLRVVAARGAAERGPARRPARPSRISQA